MRTYITLVLLYLCLSQNVFAQNTLLETEVSLNYKSKTVKEILKDLTKKHQLKFSYSNNIVNEKRIVTIAMKHVMLKDALNELFKNTDIAFQVIGDQIVFKKGIRKNSTFAQRQSIKPVAAAPEIKNETAIDMTNLIVNSHEDIIIDTIPDKYDFNLNEFDLLDVIDENYQPNKRDIKRKYKGKQKLLKAKYYILKDSLRRKGYNNSVDKLELKYNYLAQKLKQEFKQLSAKLEKLNSADTATLQLKDSSSINADTTTITTDSAKGKEYLYRPFQVTFVSPLGTNGLDSKKTVNYASFNIIGGYSAGLTGVELGGVANVEFDFVKGIQLAGVTNVVKGKTNGIQLAGTANICGDSVTGLQCAGFSNTVNGSFTGIQTAGFCNVNNGSAKGFQIAGFTNVNRGNVQGIQLAGFLNLAKKVKGMQLGVINICDTIDGLPIGLLSIVKKGGYRKFDIFATEALYFNMSYKMGVQSFYNIFTAGIQPFSVKGGDIISAAGYGVGSELNLSKKVFVNIDNVALYVFEPSKITGELNLMNRLSSSFGVRLGNSASIYAGPSFNVMVSSQYLEGNSEPGSDLPPYTMYNETFDGVKPVNVKLWFGFNAGVRF